MKTPLPGQFTSINGIMYRAKRRTNGCEGCALNNELCPNIVDYRKERPLNCIVNDIILIRI